MCKRKVTLKFVFGWCSRYGGRLLYRSDIGDPYVSTRKRTMLLKFVTEWLATEAEPGNPCIPSLFRLSAQRIAMEVFPKFLADIEKGFKAKKLSYFTNQLKIDLGLTLEKQGVPEFLKENIMEEIYIFIIVYILYIDNTNSS
jgi:hypothetical protein